MQCNETLISNKVNTNKSKSTNKSPSLKWIGSLPLIETPNNKIRGEHSSENCVGGVKRNNNYTKHLTSQQSRRQKTLPKTRGHVKNNCIYVSTSSKIVSQSPNPNVLVLGPESQVVGMNELCEGLKLAHLNIRSLRNTAHFLQLKELVRTNRIDVLTISETWLNTTVTNKKLEIDGYKLHRLDRLYKKGGGVCAYVRKNIKSSVIKELTLIFDTSFHQLWINLQYKKTKSLLACVCYRPPDCPLDCFENSLKPQYVHALSMRKSIIILGDLNCNMLDTTRREFKSLTEMTSELNLKQIIESPTRITDISQSLIDVIFTAKN